MRNSINFEPFMLALVCFSNLMLWGVKLTVHYRRHFPLFPDPGEDRAWCCRSPGPGGTLCCHRPLQPPRRSCSYGRSGVGTVSGGSTTQRYHTAMCLGKKMRSVFWAHLRVLNSLKHITQYDVVLDNCTELNIKQFHNYFSQY